MIAAFAVVGIVVSGWLLGAWYIMLLSGMVHHELLAAVTPISYGVSLKFSALMILFGTFTALFKMIPTNKE